MSTISSSTTTTTAYKVTADTTGTLVLQTGSTPTTAVTIDGSQNVGVGAVPAAWVLSGMQALQVKNASIAGYSNSAYFSTNTYYSSGWKYIATDYATQYQQNTGQHQWYVAASGTAGNAISFTQAMTLDASGNLLVGQTSVSQTANGVAIQYSGDATNLSRISVGGTGAGTGYSLYSGTASAYRFYVSYAGQIYATSTSITAISDATLKTNVRDLETGLTEVMALQPRRFDWLNGDATNVAGFIAQEVAEVLPELVDDYVYNTDENGNNITKKSLKMGDILPTLVKAIQEQQAIIETLTNRITALENA